VTVSAAVESKGVIASLLRNSHGSLEQQAKPRSPAPSSAASGSRPVSETGFYLVEARDLDEAIAMAAKIPGARSGSIEVRPIMKFS